MLLGPLIIQSCSVKRLQCLLAVLVVLQPLVERGAAPPPSLLCSLGIPLSFDQVLSDLIHISDSLALSR